MTLHNTILKVVKRRVNLILSKNCEVQNLQKVNLQGYLQFGKQHSFTTTVKYKNNDLNGFVNK